MGSSEHVEFRRRLADALEMRSMRATDLCQITGIPKGAISYYLSGKSKPKAERLHSIAKALDVSEAWLLGYNASTEEDILSIASAKMQSNKAFGEMIAIMNQMPEQKYQLILSILKAVLAQ